MIDIQIFETDVARPQDMGSTTVPIIICVVVLIPIKP